MRVREDEVLWPGGSTGVYSVVERDDYALVLPREGDGFWLVEQFRYPIGRRAWEFRRAAGRTAPPVATPTRWHAPSSARRRVCGRDGSGTSAG